MNSIFAASYGYRGKEILDCFQLLALRKASVRLELLHPFKPRLLPKPRVDRVFE